MAAKGKVLVLVSSGRGLPLKDGGCYKGAGYYLNELTVPVRALMGEGYEITFANPKGNTPQLLSLIHIFAPPRQRLVQISGFQYPKTADVRCV